MRAVNQFYVASWFAWAPGFHADEQNWQDCFANKWQATDEVADVSFLPAMQRRRLSPLARAVTHVLHHCAADDKQQMIFCTRYGEVVKADDILQAVAKGQDISPTTFGLSVYNAVAGQTSILQENTEAMTTIVPQSKDYLVAFAEALGLLMQGAESVVLVFYEEPLSEFLAPYAHFFPSIISCAVKLTVNPSESLDARLYSLTPQTYQAGDDGNGIAELIRFFALNQKKLCQGGWCLGG